MSVAHFTSADSQIKEICQKMGGVSATLYRSFVICELDKENAVPSITVHQYNSVYGSTVIFEVNDAAQESYILLAGDVFCANSLMVIETNDDMPVTVIGTDNGFSFVTYDSINRAINEGSRQVVPSMVEGYWPKNEYFHNNAKEEGNHALHENSTVPLLITEDSEGLLYGYLPDNLSDFDTDSDAELNDPVFLGTPSPSSTAQHISIDSNSRVRVDFNVRSSDVPAQIEGVRSYACQPGRYGARKSPVTSTFTLKRWNAENIKVTEEVIQNKGVLLTNAEREDNKLALYLHGGPEFFYTTAQNLLATNTSVESLLSENGAVYIPFIPRSTDFYDPENFAFDSSIRQRDILMSEEGVFDHINFIDDMLTLADKRDNLSFVNSTLYAESYGGYFALALIAHSEPESVTENFSKIVISSGMLDPIDSLSSSEFTIYQKQSLRDGVKKYTNPIELIQDESEDWVRMNREAEHPSVSLILGDNDAICSIDTAMDVTDFLSLGGYNVTVFVDKFAVAHELSSGGLLYTSHQLAQ